MTRPLPLLLAAALGLPLAARATDAPPSATLASLAELERRAPKENQFPTADPEFHREVVLLVEANRLSTGDDFLRASNLASGPFEDYRSCRMRYELLLAAEAKRKREAENLLPAYWDALLRTLGRPLRYDVFQQRPEDDSLVLDPAPKSIQFVMLHSNEAREAAAKAAGNAEVQAIVDADQMVRKHTTRMSAADFQAMGVADHQRNERVREIVKAGTLRTAQDFENASLVMQHSFGFSGFELAHELAVCSMVLGDRGMGRWLVAATYDRMLRSVGHDQRFGTQSGPMTSGNARPHLAETDESGIGDAERLALSCPTLAAKRADFYAPHPTD